MRITHEWKADYSEQTGSETKTAKRTWLNVLEVTFYSSIRWQKIYWTLGRTGPKAYCFTNTWDSGETPQVISFENEHEMRRFQEDLRLQEENARAPTSTQALTVR